VFSAAEVYGIAPSTPNYGVTSAPTQHMATSDIANGWRGLVDPNNPLTWLGGLLVLTLGLAAVSGTVRVGKVTATASVGKT
jgi:hypothetical protein